MDNRRKFAGIEINPTSDELNLMPDSNRDGLFSIAKSLGNGSNFIISGVNAVINAGIDAVVSDGYVLIDGEILKVDAQTVPKTVASDIYVFQKFTTDGPSPDWDRSFRDGDTHNVYEKNRAVVVNVLVAAPDLPINGDQIGDVLTPLLLEVTTLAKGLMSAADKTKLDGIEAGAEVNVQSNWNATSGDAFIQNKPEVLERIVTTSVIPFSNPSNINIPLPGGNTITPLFHNVVGVCKAANNGYSVGERVAFSTGTHYYEDPGGVGIGVDNAFMLDLDSTSSVTLRIGGDRMYVTEKGGSNDSVPILPSEWDIQVTVWGFQF